MIAFVGSQMAESHSLDFLRGSRDEVAGINHLVLPVDVYALVPRLHGTELTISPRRDLESNLLPAVSVLVHSSRNSPFVPINEQHGCEICDDCRLWIVAMIFEHSGGAIIHPMNITPFSMADRTTAVRVGQLSNDARMLTCSNAGANVYLTIWCALADLQCPVCVANLICRFR